MSLKVAPTNVQAAAEEFDREVKRRILEGQSVESAIRGGADAVGLELPDELVAQIVQAMNVAQRRMAEPEFVAKQRALDARIRLLVRQGLTFHQAVEQGQIDTGVRLSPQGARLLVRMLEAESEKLRDVRVDVVSDREFRDLQDGRCWPFVLGGVGKWRCCQCGETRDSEVVTCPCGHRRCFDAHVVH